MSIFLNEITDFFAHHLRDYLKASYLFGSYGSQDFLKKSDIDLVFFCDGAEKSTCEKVFNDCVKKAATSNWPKLDCRLIWLLEHPEIPLEMAQAQLLSGSPILATLSIETPQRYLTRTAQIICTSLANVRHFKMDTLSYPLSYPAYNEYFYGYFSENEHQYSDFNVRSFLNTNLYMARFFLYEKKRIISKTKKETFLLYKEHPKEEWSSHITDIYQLCHTVLQYELPHTFEHKNKLRKLCKETLVFENHFLTTLYQLLQSKNNIIYINEFGVE